MSVLDVHMFPCLSDNYGVLVHDPVSGATASIDAPDADTVLAAVAETGWGLSHVVVTHHHWDHIGGIPKLKAETGCRIVGAASDAHRIEGLDEAVADGDEFALGQAPLRAIAVPGHTLGHLAWWCLEGGVAFVGDTLFAMGCGRVFEGTPEMMWQSLDRLQQTLPDDTLVYCGHEYTLSNAKFAVTVDPDNPVLKSRLERVVELRREGHPTLPTTMAQEKATNPFLRARDAGIRRTLGLEAAKDWEVFAEIRSRKDHF